MGLLLLCLACGRAAAWLLHELGGASPCTALTDPGRLSPAAHELLERVYDGLDLALLTDYHTHLVGLGPDSGCSINARMGSWLHPQDRLRFLVYRDAAGIGGRENADAAFVEHLTGLARAQPHPARHLLLAFDWRYGADGACDAAGSEFHVPNGYAHRVAQANADVLTTCVSIHPYRPDAVEELERWAAQGVRLCKWLPNAMGIDPASERCDAFFAACARLGVALLSHTGEEQAVEARADQELGNPLRLRRALDAGVKVICAHCGSLGESQDLDRADAPRVSSFTLFLRLMAEERYEGLLFGEISALLQQNRYPRALTTLLERRDLHSRLVYGSDWPLPAINVVISTRALVRNGFLEAAELEALNELYDYNPLLFSLALARRVKHPELASRFDPIVFQRREGLGL